MFYETIQIYYSIIDCIQQLDRERALPSCVCQERVFKDTTNIADKNKLCKSYENKCI